MKHILLALTVLALAACGGNSARAPQGIEFASGPISNACLAAGRSAASRQLCQCIQGVADDMLNAGDQRRAAAFFGDPQRAQDTRQSDALGAEAFWARYRTFTDRAQRVCRPVA